MTTSVTSTDPAAKIVRNSHNLSRTELLRRLKKEIVRRNTFLEKWSEVCDFISPNDLAKAGFFYFNRGDQAQCAFCLGIIGKWERGDVPANEHRRLFPNCPFVLGFSVGNVKLEGEPSTSQQASNGFDVTGIRPEVPSDDVTITRISPEVRPEAETGKNEPQHPNFIRNDARVDSFIIHKWPCGLKQRPVELAHAGFFYEGRSDWVTCFQCGIYLGRWSPNEKPWEEHAFWSPDCQYLQLVQGTDFASEVRNAAVVKLLKYSGDEEIPPPDVITSEEGSTSSYSCRDISCKICWDSEMSIVFLPCGHLCSCASCAFNLSTCPICRKKIKGFVRTYLS